MYLFEAPKKRGLALIHLVPSQLLQELYPAGPPAPSVARDTLLDGADLLRTMESQPESSKPMWEVDSSDEDSDDDSEHHFSNGTPNAYAAPCMTIGAGTYGSGMTPEPLNLHYARHCTSASLSPPSKLPQNFITVRRMKSCEPCLPWRELGIFTIGVYWCSEIVSDMIWLLQDI